MQDNEADTFDNKTQAQLFADNLSEINVKSTPNELGTGIVENDEYFGRTFTQSPRMITNRGSLVIEDSSIDFIQIIQKG